MAGVDCIEFDPSVFLKLVQEDIQTEPGSNAFVYHCSYMTKQCVHSDPEQLPLAKVKEATEDICFDWYSLAIQLDVSYKTRKVGVNITSHSFFLNL